MILILPVDSHRRSIHPLKAAAELLQRLELLGVRLTPVDGEFIDIDAPTGVLTDALCEEIRSLKPYLLGMLRCDRCNGTEYVDVAVHGGASTRRDCRRCNRTLGFVRWYDGRGGDTQ